MSDNERDSLEDDYNNDDIDPVDDDEPSVKEKDSEKEVAALLVERRVGERAIRR